MWNKSTLNRLKKPPRGPVIHIRPDLTTRRKLETGIAEDGTTTVQHLVVDLIRREVGEPDKPK